MWCFYRFEELDVFSLLISCWVHSNFLFSLGYYRLIYLRVTGMDDGLNIKERVCYVSQKVTYYLLCDVILCCFNFKLFNAECAYQLTLISASRIFLCGFCYVSSFLCFFFFLSLFSPHSASIPSLWSNSLNAAYRSVYPNLYIKLSCSLINCSWVLWWTWEVILKFVQVGVFLPY